MIWSGVSAVVAGLALLTSIAIYERTRRAEETRERRARMPVLVVSIETHQIVLHNVGQGPALNVFFAQGEMRPDLQAEGSQERLSLDHVSAHELWFNPVHLPPVPAGQHSAVISRDTYLLRAKLAGGSDHPHADCGVSYTDAMGFAYTVRTNDAGTRLTEGRHMPAWPQAPYPGQLPRAGRWGEARPPRKPALTGRARARPPGPGRPAARLGRGP